MKSGNYLSSQQYPASTFGVKELNFCVRNGNRWDLFAIITAMVISIAFRQTIYFFSYVLFPALFQANFKNVSSSFQKTNNYIAKLHFSFSYQPFFLCVLVKIIDIFFIIRKDFVYSSPLSFLSRSSPRPISIGQLRTLLHLHSRPINLVVYKESYQPTLWDTLS